MQKAETPSYLDFDDQRYHQRITVVIRWFVVLAWLALIHYRAPVTRTLLILDVFGASLILLNGYVHWRIWNGRPITRRYAYALSIADLAVVTAGLAVTTRFHNGYFVLYYPALVGTALVFSSLLRSFGIVTAAVVAYTLISVLLEPSVNFSGREETILAVRIIAMYGVVAATNLVVSIERERRRAAVQAERAQALQNIQLQQRAQQAEVQAAEARGRIAREIHDGIAQSIYILSLQLETCAELARERHPKLQERLEGLVALSKETLLEVRHYIFDMKPYLSGDKGVARMVANQVLEFNKVTGIPATLRTEGSERLLPVPVATCLYRVTQEALANVFKHAHATQAAVTLGFQEGTVELEVQDDGQGFDQTAPLPGYGLAAMRQRAEELDGEFQVVSSAGKGTRVRIHLPG